MEGKYEDDKFVIEVDVKHPKIKDVIKSGAKIKAEAFDSDRDKFLTFMLDQVKLDILQQLKEKEVN